MEERVILIGGNTFSSSRVIEQYNPTEKNWTIFGNINTERYAFSAVQVQDKILLIGGIDNNSDDATNIVENFDLDSGELKQLQPMKVSRKYPLTAVVNDYVYVFGGTNKSVERYDPVNDVWSDMPPLSSYRRQCGIAVFNDDIFLVGGWLSNTSTNLVEAFNTTTETWRTCASMSVPRMWPGVTAFGGNIFAIGGRKQDTTSSEKFTSVERYDPISDRWTLASSFGRARYGITSFSNYYMGTILAIGGFDVDSVITVEEYNMGRDMWLEIGPINYAREMANVVIVPNNVNK